MEGQIAIEHGHRLLASAVGLLTIGLAVVSFGTRFRWAAILAAGLVVFQGLLGGITVIYRLPSAVSTAHLAMGTAFFCLLIYLWHGSGGGRSAGGDRRMVGAAFPAFVVVILVYAQMLLGALVRHLGAGLACNNHPVLCNGMLWPDRGPAQLHMWHRVLGVLVAVVILVHALPIRRRLLAVGARARAHAVLLGPILVTAQIILGMLSVSRFLDPLLVTLHLGFAELLIGHQLLLALELRRGRRTDAPNDEIPAELSGALEGAYS